MSHQRLIKKEKELMEEIDLLIQKANKCDEDEDREYKEKSGYEIPEDLKFKEERLVKIQAAKEALEKREEEVDSAIEAMLEATGTLPSKFSADNGYMSGDNLEPLEAAGLDAYIATDKGEKKNKTPLDESNRKLTKADFVFNEQEDNFTCPGGQILTLRCTLKTGKKKYQGSSQICNNCNYLNRCCKSTTGQARTINTDGKEPIRQQMTEKMEATESKEIYKERKIIVEPVLGQIKNTGFRGFSVRGKNKTSGEFSLVCAVHNIKKIAKALFKGVARSESKRLVTVEG